MPWKLEQVLAYHQATKHQVGRFAQGPGYLDWETQPDPFRRYRGAPLLELDIVSPDPAPRDTSPTYESASYPGRIEPAALHRASVSQLFFDSLAISAWKRAGDATWALRVNPSSGNLHPTEGYLVCGPVDGLTATPLVAHYAPREHALEVRAEFPLEVWQALVRDLPPGAILVGMSSIHWREAWKYGERAFRYCQHDVGHAIAAISLAAAGLGWQATLLDDLGSDRIARLLGLAEHQDAETEHPDCLLAINPQSQTCATSSLPLLPGWDALAWQGRPNRLSPTHVPWPIIDGVAGATTKPPTDIWGTGVPAQDPGQANVSSTLSLRTIVHQRRSAVAMDPQGSMPRDTFYRILLKTLARPARLPFNTLPWRPLVHLALFVHRVEGLAPGLYCLIRDPEQAETLQAAMAKAFSWERPGSCPPDLELYLLQAGDARNAARGLSCQQAIASDGCFSLGMITTFAEPLRHFGPWFYRRLFWECGLIGQVLYLEAEAAGVRGTGIGCFFDDPVHELLGLTGTRYQSLYHFTVGHPIQDERLITLPAYSRSERSSGTGTRSGEQGNPG